MYICFAYTYTFILVLVGYAGCSDKPTDTQGSGSNQDNLPSIRGLSLVPYSDSEDEDNFQVTEPTEDYQSTESTLTEQTTESTTEDTQPTQTTQQTTQHTTEPTKHTTEQSTQTTEDTEPKEHGQTTEQSTEQSTQTTEHTELHPETIPVEVGSDEEDEPTPTETIKDEETQTDLEKPEEDDKQRKEELHVLYYVPPPQQPYGTYHQLVPIPPIKPLPPQVPGESPKYYLISSKQNKYGEHETIRVTHMEYKPILQPVLYYEPFIGPQPYPPIEYPTVSYPIIIPQFTQPPPTEDTTKHTTEHTQHTQTTQHTELEPETIPVEVGSDESEGEDGEDKEPSKVVKKCKEVKFMKKNKEGNLIPMNESDYEIIYSNINVTKYEFIGKLEEIYCDDMLIFKHIPSTPYAKLLTHNKTDENFILLIGKIFVTLRLGKKRWRLFSYQIPDYVKLYKHNIEGKLVEMSPEEYIIDFKFKRSFKYIMRKDISCVRIEVKNILAWEKTDVDSLLCGFSMRSKYSLVLRFNRYAKIVVLRNGTYKVLLKKSNNK